jgi:hypothetical protein
VGTLTLFFKEMVSQFFPDPCQGDDLTFRELLVKVMNEILLRLRDGNLSEADLETIGFALRRVWFVAQAYKAAHEQHSIGEWVQKLVGYAKEAGVPVPV